MPPSGRTAVIMMMVGVAHAHRQILTASQDLATLFKRKCSSGSAAAKVRDTKVSKCDAALPWINPIASD
ncbi:MAG: hypothetical protein CTY31_01455 [Hyphomicrobium sp.]|nr:MAG: hypothetical protein CTY39_05635 [Hyphomicrobium sp.]PPD01466.1 MAG: hypothetical protein CTY31_01455 [Hyphomicrobium sp.]